MLETVRYYFFYKAELPCGQDILNPSHWNTAYWPIWRMKRFKNSHEYKKTLKDKLSGAAGGASKAKYPG